MIYENDVHFYLCCAHYYVTRATLKSNEFICWFMHPFICVFIPFIHFLSGNCILDIMLDGFKEPVTIKKKNNLTGERAIL